MPLLDIFNVSGIYSSHFEVKDDVFTGNVDKILWHRDDKHKIIQSIMEHHDNTDSFAFGDSEGDIEMLNSVTYAICINPSDGLREVAIERGWHVCDPDNVLEKVASVLKS